MDVQSLLPADALRPRWSSASALVYLGGFVILFATSALLGILGDDHGDWALIGYSALATVLALALAQWLAQSGRAVAAGVLATLAVIFFATFVGSGIFKSGDPALRAKAIVEATTHYRDAEILARVSAGLGEPMVGISTAELAPEQLLETRGW